MYIVADSVDVSIEIFTFLARSVDLPWDCDGIDGNGETVPRAHVHITHDIDAHGPSLAITYNQLIVTCLPSLTTSGALGVLRTLKE